MVFQVSANDLDLGPNGKVRTNPHVYTQIIVKSNDASLVEMNVFEFLLYYFHSAFHYSRGLLPCCANLH